MAEIRRDDILDPQIAEGFEDLAKKMLSAADALDRINQAGIDLNKTQKSLSDSQKKVADASKQVAKNSEATQKETFKLTNLQTNYTKSLVSLNKQKEKEEAASKRQALQKAKIAAQEEKTTKANINSINGLIYANKKLVEERNKLDLSTEKGRKKAAELNNQIDANTKKVMANGSEADKQRMNIGNYRNSLQGLTVSLQNGEIGLRQFLKSFIKLSVGILANPVGLIIIGIVGALALLYKAFTRTDSGGTELEARFKQLNVVLVVFMQRVSKVTSALVNLFKGNFKQAATDFGNAVSGVGEQMKEATKSAYEYTYALDALEDSEDSYISQKAKNQNQIAKLESIAQDQRASVEIRKAAAESAIKIGEAQLKKESEFAKTRYEEEIKYAAAKYNVSIDKLKKFIEADDVESKKLLENDTELASARELMGNEGQKNLEELYSKNIELETKFFEENKRNISKLSGFEKELQAEKLKKIDKYKVKKEKEANFLNELEQAKITNIEDETKREIAAANFAFKEKKKQYEKEVTDLKIRGELIKQAEILKNNQIAEINKNATIKDEENAKNLSDKVISEYEKQSQAAAKSYQERTTNLKKQLLKGKITEEKYSKEVEKLSYKQALNQIKSLKLVAENKDLTLEDREKLLQQIADAENNLLDIQINNANESAEEVKRTEDEKAAKRQQVNDAAINAANETFNFIGTLQDRQLSNLEAKKNQELLLAGANEEAKSAIERKYAIETAKIKRKQAIADRAKGLFNVAINTAVGITKALSETNPALAVIIGIIGALQAATILAQPIPQFDKGSKYTPDTYIAGEKRPEIRIHKGKSELVTTPSLFTKSAGDQIISGMQTDKILNHGLYYSMRLNRLIEGDSENSLTDSKLDLIYKALVARKDIEVNIDKRGVSTIYSGTKNKSLRIDKYFN